MDPGQHLKSKLERQEIFITVLGQQTSVCSCFLLIKLHRKCNGRKTTVFAELSALHRKEYFQLPGSGLIQPPSGNQHYVVISLTGEPEEWPVQGVHRGIWPQIEGLELGAMGAKFTLVHKGLSSDFMRIIRIVIAFCL